jgi:hypothetical protein
MITSFVIVNQDKLSKELGPWFDNPRVHMRQNDDGG